MAICSCCLPAHCCQPAVAGGFIYADLWDELSTHLAQQALFTQSFPVCDQLLQAFPFPSTLGEVTLPAFSGLCVYLQFTWEVGLPPLLWSFPPTAAFTSFPAPSCWPCATTPAFSGQAWLVYLQFQEGFPSPSLALRAPHPVYYMSLLFLLLITQFLFFSLGGGQSVQGAMLI
jgi:hypothetical protein